MKNCVQNIASIWIIDIHTLADSRHRLFALLFACLASLSAVFAQSGKCGDNLTWTLENGVLTISGTGPMQDFDFSDTTSNHYKRTPITSVVINEGITSIGKYAFSSCSNLTSVTIPNSVTSIGNYAFYGCESLTSVRIPNSVTSIGKDAFCYCSALTSINIPNSVNSIEEHAFYGCENLTSITIPNSVTSIGDDAFDGCSRLSSPLYNDHVFAYLPENYYGTYTIPEGIETISGGAFSYCKNLTYVKIPNSVTHIGASAFSGCKNLTSITIPNSVTNIGGGACDGAFWGCALTSPVYNDHVFAYLPRNYSGSYIIPDGIETIAPGAFSGCSVTSVTIPNSVTSIGEEAFSSNSLKSITIPNSVTSIGYDAFCICDSLTSITIPKNIQLKTYTDESYYLDKSDERYLAISTNIMWPISGLPADKLHSMRQAFLGAYASKDVASALNAKVDDANFHTALHNAMRKEYIINHELTNLKFIPSSKVPEDAELDRESYWMVFTRFRNGIYTFFLHSCFSLYDSFYYPDHEILNYDIESNRPLTLGDILQVDQKEEINRIYRYLVNQWLTENRLDMGRLDDSWVADFDRDLDFRDKEWYIGDDGIVFTFDMKTLDGEYNKVGLVEITLPLSTYKHLYRPEAFKFWAQTVQPATLFSPELDTANKHISQIVQQHNEVINRSPYTQYLNKNERNRYLHTYSPFQIPKAYDYDQAKAFCDSLQRVANSLSQQDPAMTVTSIKDYLRATRPDDFVKAYFKENPTAKAHLESEHKEYRCHYASFTDFVIQYEQGRLQPSERNCRELKWQEYKPYYNNKKAFDADYDKGDEHLEAHKRHYELKWAEYKQYYSSREAFDADYHLGDATLEIHKKREIKWAECADYYEARFIFDFDYDKGETVVDAHRRRIDEAWSSLQQLPEELLVKKKLIGASESKKEDILNLFSLYRQLKPSPHFQSLAADFLISRNKKMSKEYEKNGAYFSSKIAFLTAYFSGDYKHIIKSMKK